MKVKCDIEARSGNHCCCGKARNLRSFECVFV